jgi:hypothetical protein
MVVAFLIFWQELNVKKLHVKHIKIHNQTPIFFMVSTSKLQTPSISRIQNIDIHMYANFRVPMQILRTNPPHPTLMPSSIKKILFFSFKDLKKTAKNAIIILGSNFRFSTLRK